MSIYCATFVLTLHLFFKFDIRFADLYVVVPESQEFYWLQESSPGS